MKEDMHSSEKGHEEDEIVVVNLPHSGLDFAQNSDSLVGSGTKPIKGLTSTMKLTVSQSLPLAGIYIIMSMAYFFAIRYSRLNYTYNSLTLVAITEVMKMMISIALKYCIDGEFIPRTILFSNTRQALWKKSLPYAIPAFLYAVYNNMTFNNLDNFDLGTYQVFLQTRVWFTGIMFTLILGRALSLRKWLALILLACGVALKYFSPVTFEIGSWVGIVIFQAFISSLAEVYNECMFKNDPGLSIHMQNFFMYFYGILFNVLFGIIFVPDFAYEFTFRVRQTRIFVLIVLFGALTGISASFILKYIDVIVKALASGVEVPLTAIMAAVLIGEVLYMQDIVATIIVTFAIYMYYTKVFEVPRFIQLNFRRRERLVVVN